MFASHVSFVSAMAFDTTKIKLMKLNWLDVSDRPVAVSTHVSKKVEWLKILHFYA